MFITIYCHSPGGDTAILSLILSLLTFNGGYVVVRLRCDCRSSRSAGCATLVRQYTSQTRDQSSFSACRWSPRNLHQSLRRRQPLSVEIVTRQSVVNALSRVHPGVYTAFVHKLKFKSFFLGVDELLLPSVW